MSKYTICLDTFSGSVVDLPKRKRTIGNILAVLSVDPCVSVFDALEHEWLMGKLDTMQRRGLVSFKKLGFPWWQYKPTEKGKLLINEAGA